MLDQNFLALVMAGFECRISIGILQSDIVEAFLGAVDIKLLWIDITLINNFVEFLAVTPSGH